MLTIQQVRNAKPIAKSRKLYDRDGLYLVVTPAGSKLWRGKYRVNSREKTLSLRPFPRVGLSEARKLEDPSATKQAEKQRNMDHASSKPTFIEIAREWHTRPSPGWSKKHASQVWRSLDLNVLPQLGPCPIDEVKPHEIMELIEAIESREAGQIAARELQRIRAVFSRAVALGFREVNPASELHHHLKPRRKRPQTALSTEELPSFLHALDTYTGHPSTRLCLRPLMLTSPGPARSVKPGGPSSTASTRFGPFRPNA